MSIPFLNKSQKNHRNFFDNLPILQIEEQPSLLILLPSSHCSTPTLRLSPQIGVQLVATHAYPFSN